MSEQFRPYHISEESPEFNEYKKSIKEFKASVPTESFGAEELRWVKDQKTYFEGLIAASNSETGRYISPEEADELKQNYEKLRSETLTRLRESLLRKTRNTGQTLCLGELFKESLDLPEVNSIVRKFDSLDAIYEIPPELKAVLALTNGELKAGVINSIIDAAIRKIEAEQEQEYIRALNAGAPAEELLAIDNRTLMRGAQKLKEIDAAIPQLTEICRTISEAEISNGALERILEHHELQFKKKAEELKEYEQDFRKRYLGEIEKAAAEGWLPVDLDVAKKRLAETTLVLKDVLDTASPTVHGGYQSDHMEITVSSVTPEEEYDDVTFHEATHLISGRTILQKDDADWELKNTDHQRIGLSFNTNTWGQRRFNWFNEAVTEEISMRLRNTMMSSSYRNERKYLLQLYRSGVDQKTIYEAYFENFDPGNKTTPVPKWKTLNEKIRENFDWQGFIQFDRDQNEKRAQRRNE